MPAQPPPYSPKCDVQLPIQYLPPYVAAQLPASTVTEQGGSHSEPCLSSRAEGEARLVASDEGRLNSEVCQANARNVSLVAADQDSSGGAIPYVYEDGANSERQPINDNLASSLTAEARRTDVGVVQAVLAGRGALSGIEDNQAAASTGSTAHSQTSFVGDELEQQIADAATPGIPEQLPASDTQQQQQQRDDGALCGSYFGRQGADNVAFESCSLPDEPQSVNSDASIPDSSQHQFNECERDASCRFVSSGRDTSSSKLDNNDISESNCSQRDTSSQQSVAGHQLSDDIEEYLSKSTVTIEESEDVFV